MLFFLYIPIFIITFARILCERTLNSQYHHSVYFQNSITRWIIGLFLFCSPMLMRAAEAVYEKYTNVVHDVTIVCNPNDVASFSHTWIDTVPQGKDNEIIYINHGVYSRPGIYHAVSYDVLSYDNTTINVTRHHTLYLRCLYRDTIIACGLENPEPNYFQMPDVEWFGHFRNAHLSRQADDCDTTHGVLIESKSKQPIVSVELIVSRIFPTPISRKDSVCVDGFPYVWEEYGLQYDSAGVYKDTIRSVQGCDSLYLHLDLSVPHVDSALIDTLICQDQLPFLWKPYAGREIVLSEPGFYVDTIRNKVRCHCDSFYYQINLRVDSFQTKVIRDTICETDPPFVWQTWRDKDSIIMQSGIYYDTLKYTTGCHCDSIHYELHLRIDSARLDSSEATICYGESYRWHTWREQDWVLYQGDTVYRDTAYYQSGCDSVHYALKLNVLSVKDSLLEHYICMDSSLIWRDKLYTFRTVGDTVLNDRIPYTDSPCDSVRLRMTVHVKDCCPVLDGKVTTEAVCADDEKIYITFSDFEEDVTQYSLHFDSLALLQGWRDTAGFFEAAMPLSLDLPIPIKSDSLQYVRPDNYRYTLLLKGVCHNYLELVDTIQVYYPSWIIEQRWSDVLAVVNSQYNGGYEFSAIQWYHEGYPVEGQGAHQSYLLQRPHLTYGDDYWAELTRVDDGKTIRTCIVQPVEMSDSTEIGEWGEDVPGEYWTYYIDGRLIGKGICPINRGVYVILWRGLDGTVKTYKLLKD